MVGNHYFTRGQPVLCSEAASGVPTDHKSAPASLVVDVERVGVLGRAGIPEKLAGVVVAVLHGDLATEEGTRAHHDARRVGQAPLRPCRDCDQGAGAMRNKT